MTPKEYLSQTYRLNELINSNIREIGRLRSLLCSLSVPADGKVDKSPAADAPFTRTVEKIIDLENDINSQIDELVCVQKEIRQVIDAVEDKDERLVLRLRYVEHCSWEEISKRMSFSLAQCHRIHRNALKNVKIIKDDTKCY